MISIAVLYTLVALAASGADTDQPSAKTANQNSEEKTMSESNDEKKGRVTGIGGIFFKVKDPATLKAWYNENLGLVTDEYGTLFEFRNTDNPEEKNYLQWSPFTETTEYFKPSEKPFMINYRVVNIEALIEQLKKSGVEVIGEIQEFEYGKFAHIMDPEGNKIELWEPVDNEFTQSYDGKTTH